MLLHFRHSGLPGRQEFCVAKPKSRVAFCSAGMRKCRERRSAHERFWLLFFGHAKKSDPPEARYLHRELINLKRNVSLCIPTQSVGTKMS